MFIQSLFRETNQDRIIDFMRQNPFAAIVSFDGEKPVGTHIPVEVSVDSNNKLYLEGHVARANPQWKTFGEQKEILVIFSGAHVYISPRWYAEPHSTVPTWAYMIVHVYGRTAIMTDSQLQAHLAKLVNRYENGTSYDLAKVPAETMKHLTSAVVGFYLEVTKIEASFKLNQNRDPKSYAGIIAELEKSSDENSQLIAAAMREIS